MTDPIIWIPVEPNRWRRIAARVRAWRWRRYGGLSPRWQDMGAVQIDVAKPEFFLCSLPTGHDGPCVR